MAFQNRIIKKSHINQLKKTNNPNINQKLRNKYLKKIQTKIYLLKNRLSPKRKAQIYQFPQIRRLSISADSVFNKEIISNVNSTKYTWHAAIAKNLYQSEMTNL